MFLHQQQALNEQGREKNKVTKTVENTNSILFIWRGILFISNKSVYACYSLVNPYHLFCSGISHYVKAEEG